MRYTYGTPGSILYNPSDPEHRKRAQRKYLGPTGNKQLDIFSPTLFKVADFCFQIARLELNHCPGYAGIGYAGVPQEDCLL
jgi:hypothetical protein